MECAAALQRRLCAAAFFGACSYAICRMPLLPLLARDLGATPAVVGLVVAASTVAGILVKLPAGAWSDVFGRRRFLVAAGVLYALMPLAYLGVASLTVLGALRFVHGHATAIFGPVSAASVSEIAPADRRATWLSTLSLLQRSGQAVAPLIAGVVLSAAGYDTAFVVAAAVGVAVPVLMWRWPPPIETPAPDRWRSFRIGLRAVAGDPAIMRTSLLQAALLAATNAVTTFVPLYAADVLRLSLSSIGIVFAMQTAAGVVARPVGGWLADRISRERTIVIGVMACAAGIAALTVAARPGTLTVLLVTIAFGTAIASTAASALITDRARRANYGAAHGVFGTIYDVGDALGPIAGGVVVASAGYSGLFVAAAVMLVLAAAAQRASARW